MNHPPPDPTSPHMRLTDGSLALTPPLPLSPLLHPLNRIYQARGHCRVLPEALRLPQDNQLHLPSPISRGNHQHPVQNKSISSHPSLSFVPPIFNAYLQVEHILRRAAQTPPTPPPHLTPNIDKLPASLPRVRTLSLPRVKPLPLPRFPASPPHWYPTRHTCHNQLRPVHATTVAVDDTITGAKTSLQTL